MLRISKLTDYGTMVLACLAARPGQRLTAAAVASVGRHHKAGPCKPHTDHGRLPARLDVSGRLAVPLAKLLELFHGQIVAGQVQ